MAKLNGAIPLVTKEFATTTPWWRRGPYLLGAAGLALLIATLLLGLGSCGGPDDRTAGPDTGTGVVVPSNPDLPKQDPAKVHLPTDPQWLTGAPAGMVWRTDKDLPPLPYGAADGPRKIDTDAGTATGYSQTPQGAALAAYQVAMRIALAANFKAVVDTQTVFDHTSADDVKAHRGKPDPSALQPNAHASAFKVLAFLNSQATVQYAVPNPFNGSYNSYQFTVVWKDNDWKLVAPNDTASAKALASIDGFTPF